MPRWIGISVKRRHKEADLHEQLASGIGCHAGAWRTQVLPHQEVAMPDDTSPAPYFDAHVFVCCNRRPDGHPRGSCAAKGSEKLRDYMKARTKELQLERTRINMAGCLDRCELGPCMVIYPAGIWYQFTTISDVDAILEQHLSDGVPVDRLMLQPGQAK